VTESKHRMPHDRDPAADDTPGPSKAPQSASQEATDATLEGQLGPDEISEPDEVVRNNEAKLHARGEGIE
jgi:hypothetical protein